MIDSETMLASGVLKVGASRDALAERLALVARGVSSRTAVLVLGGIQLRAAEGRLQLAATDMELSLRASVDADVEGEGEVVVPGRLLLDIVRALPDSDVQIEHRSDEAMLHVTSGAASYRVHTYAAEDFPRLPDVESLQLHPVDRDALLETIARVGRSASRDESRPVLTGILVRFEHELQLPREELLDVVRRVSLMAQRNSPLRLRFADGELTVSAQTPDVGEARESLPAPYNADAMEIGFNAEFLRDGLDSVDSQTVRLKLISPLRPAVLEGESSDYTYLIMPIRLAG